MSSVLITSTFTLGAGLTTTFGNENPAYLLQGGAPNQYSLGIELDFTDNGAIQVASNQAGATLAALYAQNGTNGASVVDVQVAIGLGGSLSVDASGANANAYGLSGEASGLLIAGLTNSGSFSVSATGNATGVFKAGLNNSGTFTVSGETAVGVAGGSTNSGQFTVSGVTSAVGFDFQGGSFTNSGTVSVTATSGMSIAYRASGSNYYTYSTITNAAAGTISAQIAIDSVDLSNTGQSPTITLHNSGAIHGDIDLGLGQTTGYSGSNLYNTGSIIGDIHLSANAPDLYDGRGGTLSGTIYLGGGADTVYLGNDGETVVGGTGTAVIHAGSGADTISGGSGSDVIYAGTGTDTLSGGGGADTFVFASASDSAVITDFSAAQGDKIDLSALIGFYDLQAVLAAATSSGGNTVIALGGGGSVTLDNVQKTDLTSGDFVFSPIQIPTGSAVVTLPAGQTVSTVSGPAAIFQASSGGTFINQGTVAISTSGAAQGVIADANGADPTAVFENNGTFTFSAGTRGVAGYDGVSAAVEVVTLKNNGVFAATITSDAAFGASGDLINTGSYTVQGTSATGVQDVNAGGLVQNSAGATLSVSATNGPATGVFFLNGGEFDNAGALTVAGSSQTNTVSMGVDLYDRIGQGTGYSKLVNSGTITVTGVSSSYGVVLNGGQSVPANQYNLVNSGTITAPIAVYGSQFGSGAAINNSGTLNGDVALWQGGQILNTGVINGNVDFNYNSAYLNSTAGTVHGTVFIGSFGGRILLGAEDNTIVIGAVGNNTIDGGGGTNTLSFGSVTPVGTSNYLTNGVTISLFTPGVAQQNTGVGTITLSNIQKLVGSAYSDHLIGGTGTNVLTGEGGADVFVFAPGDGAETVTDFTPSQGDRIEFLSSFSQFRSFADVLAHSSQVGADTVIAIGSGSLTLKNVALGSLTTSDFILSAPTVGPGIGGTPTTGSSPFVTVTLTGTSGDDWLQGGIGDDTLHGGAGSDYLVGGAGTNTATYDGAYAQYTVGFGADGEITVSGGPEGGTDILVGIQRIQFADGYLASSSSGAGQAYTFYSPSGSPLGPSLVRPPATDDQTLYGTPSDDSLQGGSGNDTLHGGPGSDYLDGGAGLNTATYDGAYRQYVIGAGGATVSGGPEGGTDRLVHIQRIQFVDGYIATSATDLAGQVYRLYEATLGRAPDPEGLAGWVHALNAGTSLQTVASGFVTSAEFQNVYGALDDTHFVTLLYNNVLHRGPDQGGLSYWLGYLAQGHTRAEVVLGFSESPEDIGDSAGAVGQGLWVGDVNAAEAARLYDTVFGREPDATGLPYWTHALDSGMSLQTAADGFVASPEFQSAYAGLDDTGFLTRLYQNVLHRGPDAGGLQGWLGYLAAGHTRAEVVLGFSDSAEHIANTAPHIDNGVWVI